VNDSSQGWSFPKQRFLEVNGVRHG